MTEYVHRALAWCLHRGMQPVGWLHRIRAFQGWTGPLLRRLHRRATRVDEARYRARFPTVAVVRYSKGALERQRVAGYQSQAGQDHFAHQTFFRTRTAPGTYVDVGANDPVRFSNTFYFDRHLGWRGLALDPLDKHGPAWRRLRSAEMVVCAASDVDGHLEFDEVADTEAHADALSAVHGGSTKYRGFRAVSRRVAARRLTAILQERAIDHVDFMSIDVEGHELNVLRGIDFSRITVDVIAVENNVPRLWGCEAIRDYLQERGFLHCARVWLFDDVFVRKPLAGEP